MDDTEKPKEDQTPPPEPFINCQMCGCRVEERHTTMMAGRRICFGCAAVWFDDEID